MKVTFNISKRRTQYALAAAVILVSSGIVVAFNTNNPSVFGHSAAEVQGLVGSCPAGQFLTGFSADGTRICAATSGTGGTATRGTAVYTLRKGCTNGINDGISGTTAGSPTMQFPIATELTITTEASCMTKKCYWTGGAQSAASVKYYNCDGVCSNTGLASVSCNNDAVG